MKKVLIPTKLNAVARELLKDSGGYNVVHDDSTELKELAAQHPDTYALIVRSDKVTPEIIDALPELKVIVRAGAGYNTIDIRYARQRGVDVMNTPGANANAVAEEVVTLMLADARHVVQADVSTREGKWEKKTLMGRELTGKTVGIVGFGAIGRLVARRLAGFDIKLLTYDPVLSEDRAEEFGAELVDLPTLFERCDYISLHIPENDDTRGMINKDLAGRMKEGATLVNCARAGIINEDDLRAVKAEKNIRFLNDVYPKDAAGEKSVADIADLMMPHLGASTVEANYNAAKRAADQLMEYDEKGMSTYIVNRDVPEGLDEMYADLAYDLAHLARQWVGARNKLKMIETSVYGSLKPFSDWMIVPILAAVSEEFDRSMEAAAAREYLKDMGIDYNDRETDDTKNYGNTITIDLAANVDHGSLRRVSIRGTVAEGRLMISRIDDFDKLYFEPEGHAVFFRYEDRPGVLGQIGVALADHGINIDDVRNPHDESGKYSLAIMKTSSPVDQEIVDRIAGEIDAPYAVGITF
ncbi:NAD(P)-dependent oxidoreductase [Kiritimatiella glycovorans]|uniref:D-3-phosphoglycerate dehydrogenase n=1 Tax=Kiritimatiella glycovorans TaxID=1307763 RepID=A0A0G3EHB5_9BACT|nr:NAD(P)-dependent oxidoreductase [Kiritimatiella glycovorans]AKJ64225.1 D-3-phosphoglycerate dehydrogenase [Kiritimatiella glycovorans]